ncbi:MAG: D-TA family PLP-dependent enzyme [Chloroflexota bacterium]|nr:D-TA family PLP-dependent enzyme [Chloroflexota bacterium]
MHIDQLETPVAVLDLDRLERNIGRFQAYLDEHGIANRPHIKTHKSPEIASLQVAAGAVGITCQKLGEAEVMVQGGIEDIFVPYNIVGATKLERLVRLSRQARMSVTADSEVVVRGLSSAMRGETEPLPVLVECDTGMQRCGAQTPRAAAELARVIAGAPGLRFGGLMTYPNSKTTNEFVRETKMLLASGGIPVQRVSGGGTSCMWEAHTHPDITEHRAGEYAFGDRHSLRAGVLGLEDCAFTVITTVVSRPTESRGILDGGSKTFSSDVRDLEGHGLILEYPEARIYALSEEHGHVDFSACPQAPEISERLTVIPNHCCVVTNLFNEVVGVRGGTVETVLPVACRGRLQ